MILALKHIYVGKKSNIGIIVLVALNYVVSRMEGIHNIPTLCKKPLVRPSYMKIKKVVMFMFRYEHMKKGRIPGELYLYQICKQN